MPFAGIGYRFLVHGWDLLKTAAGSSDSKRFSAEK